MMFDGNTIPLFIIVVMLSAAPLLVARTALKTSEILPAGKLTTRLIVRYWIYWVWAIAANFCLLAVQWHEFALLAGVIYVIAALITAILGLCVLLVASTNPA